MIDSRVSSKFSFRIVDAPRCGSFRVKLTTNNVAQMSGELAYQVLDDPGAADLSAWVDFGALRQAAQGSGTPVSVHGPVSQVQIGGGQFSSRGQFLNRLETTFQS